MMPVVFNTLTEMKEYCGPEANLSGGGKFVENHGWGHELFNFKEDDGHYYGYTTPWGEMNIKRISGAINSDVLGEYVDNVLVVFTGSRPGIGRIIVGWYKNARVYSKSVDDNRESRILKLDSGIQHIKYNVVCDASNALLIAYEDRSFVVPQARMTDDGVGVGHHNTWYADKPKDLAFKEKVIEYIHTYDDAAAQSNELKYHLHDESHWWFSTSKQVTHSQSARQECIKIHGCVCNICGFDFEKAYGKAGKDYIEVHHITPVGQLSSAEGYEGTDPQKDLIPVCSNCHSMLHRKKIPYTPDEIRGMLKLDQQ